MDTYAKWMISVLVPPGCGSGRQCGATLTWIALGVGFRNRAQPRLACFENYDDWPARALHRIASHRSASLYIARLARSHGSDPSSSSIAHIISYKYLRPPAPSHVAASRWSRSTRSLRCSRSYPSACPPPSSLCTTHFRSYSTYRPVLPATGQLKAGSREREHGGVDRRSEISPRSPCCGEGRMSPCIQDLASSTNAGHWTMAASSISRLRTGELIESRRSGGANEKHIRRSGHFRLTARCIPSTARPGLVGSLTSIDTVRR